MKDPKQPAPAPGSTDVPCVHDSQHVCLKKIEAVAEPAPAEAPTTPAPSTPAPTVTEAPAEVVTTAAPVVETPTEAVTTAAPVVEPPKEYKMVQFGPKSGNQLFNMSWSEDTGNAIAQTWAAGKSMHDRWPQPELLRKRQLNLRLYHSPDKSSYMVCMIMNNYGGENDGLKNYYAEFEISALNGQTIGFAACDDMGECKKPRTGTTLSAIHGGVVTHSDGFCVSPLQWNGNAISIKAKNIQNLEGINFQGSDGSMSEYTFYDGAPYGLTGDVSENGLVTNGEIPEIIINPAGIEV